ncbi:hypothetical protein METBIDRAFT_78080 [Metschnikowia bicuspidata var. bicuspidata NRRL YB-4993]|uniref:Amino acid transporter transmembrane domain-containing protein n=1 Tax=Metschnikowia bicuspidata var. bicuspidata NRRL YB-4993 TaxID=869754 RepID=A0A1A0HAE5_9ASCO|nr:hypothetical protein METBIDRAFT_78080 [Metschnikowia bicuspidata var. bicuspidata NRRL YB-4993]OBA20975.1 hypothetical protein METBIDRAFT_78080 [Metschnikowia bicuspidata var. bicuspidata NRRL YB-4993]
MSLPRDIASSQRRSSMAKIARSPWAASPGGLVPRHSPSVASLLHGNTLFMKNDASSVASKTAEPHSKSTSPSSEQDVPDAARRPLDAKIAELVQRHLRPDAELALAAEGADVTRHIYRFGTDKPPLQRSKSMSLVTGQDESRRGSSASSLNVPGGFRRQYVLAHSGKRRPTLLTRNFVEFLSIYGHFAGEDLEDDDAVACHYSPYKYDAGSDEETPLVPRTPDSYNPAGTASDAKAYFLLVKAFVGTGVLFLPKAFASGGLVFLAAMLFLFGLLSYWCYVVLVYAKLALRVSGFSEMGRVCYGTWFQQLILLSIVLSQVGFVATYIVFTAENLRAFLVNVSSYETADWNIVWFIALEACVLTPLSLVRDITRLSLLALLANVFIMVGLVTIVCFTAMELLGNSLQPGPGVHYLFNKDEFSLFVGVAIFAFEGIGLIIPIQESMIYPDHFPRVLRSVVLTISTIFVFVGGLGYLTFGDKIDTVILLNLPQNSPFVILVQLFYAFAILLSTPIQIFPAVRLIELRVFPPSYSGKASSGVKCMKNLLRLAFVILTSAVAFYGGKNLDKFVSFVGCFACIPLVYMYPPMLHLKTCCDYQNATSNRRKMFLMAMVDYTMIVLGGIALVYTTYDLLTH